MRSNLDGTDVEVFTREGLKLPNNIAIDPFYRKLCVLDAGKPKRGGNASADVLLEELNDS